MFFGNDYWGRVSLDNIVNNFQYLLNVTDLFSDNLASFLNHGSFNNSINFFDLSVSSSNGHNSFPHRLYLFDLFDDHRNFHNFLHNSLNIIVDVNQMSHNLFHFNNLWDFNELFMYLLNFVNFGDLGNAVDYLLHDKRNLLNSVHLGSYFD
jgi:hypothetical protein